MTISGSKKQFIGFLTVREYEGQGLFGGYLVLNAGGRPIEFHCTAPVRPNRAQEILYGPTLKPYLYGEQIGQALMQKSKTKPLLVFTDSEPVLAVRGYSPVPVAFVPEPKKVEAQASPIRRWDAPHSGAMAPASSRLHYFSVADQRLAVDTASQNDEAEITKRWQQYAREFDLLEPFERIREAIEEARRSVR